MVELVGLIGFSSFILASLVIVAESLRLLPDPYDRFASFTGVTAIAIGAAPVVLFAQRAGYYELPESLIGATSVLALVAAVSEWPAFFPPASYRRRFEAPAV